MPMTSQSRPATGWHWCPGSPAARCRAWTRESRARAIARIVRADEGTELIALVQGRVCDLADYQNRRFAPGYAEFVESVRREESRRIPGSTRLTEPVVRYLHKLMVYKDEYEVARLALAPAAEQIEAEFGEGAKVSYHMHPPLPRALGVTRKLGLGPWSRPAFRVLRSVRSVRGSWLDPFGHTRVRRTERSLVGEYRAAIDALLALLDPSTLTLAVDIAGAPDRVRGYEEMKLANVAACRAELARLDDEFRALAAAQP